MRRVALLSRDDMLIDRIRAAVADMAQILPLDPQPAEFGPEVANLQPDLVLVEVDGAETLSALPQIMKSIAAAATAVEVVVLGDADNAGDVLAAVRAGSADFIDREEPIATLRSHITRRFSARAEVPRSEPGMFSVVLNAQPGSAGGLFALHLAIVRAMRSEEALLIDCHLPVSEAGAALDLPMTYSLADAVRDTGRLDRTLLLSAIAHHEPSGLRVLPLSLRSTDDIGLSPEMLLSALRAIRPLFRETVLNAGGIREPVLLTALAQWASIIYLVCPQKFTALRDAKDLLSELPANFDAAGRIVLIVDEYSPGITMKPEHMLAALQLNRMVLLPTARDELINGLNVGQPYVLARPRSRYAQAIDAAADGLVAAPVPIRRGIVQGIGSRLRTRKA
jgi:pilus assembly protein CpaE